MNAYARRAVLVGAAFWVCVAALVVGALWRERQQSIAYAMKSADATVALMEQHTATTFHAVSLALDDAVNRLSAQPVAANDASLRQSMRDHLRGLPYVRAMYVIGPDGFIIHDTDFPKTPHVSLADRDYFKLHQQEATADMAISAPLQSRSGTGWFVAATRRIQGPDGSFRGVAVAAIQLRYFSDLYLRMGLGEGERIVLFHRDGRLMAQYPPDDERIGRTFVEFPLFTTHLPRNPAGSYVSSGPPLPFERIFSYRSVEGQPLVVAMSYNMDAVLAPWRRAVTGAVSGLLGLLLICIWGVAVFIRHERQRHRARERMEEGEKLEALGRLTSGIAHDFGNVLGIVNNNIEIIERASQGSGGPVQRAAASARRAVATGTQLTRDLMSIARRRELTIAPTDLHEAVERFMPLLEQAAGKGVSLEVRPAEGVPHCLADRTQLEVALINLVVNARDAMHGKGSIVLAIARVEREDGTRGIFSKRFRPCVELTVTDTGPGMSADVRRRAPEPFFSTKGEQGTGLGLSQVYGFMRQLGGDVWIDSEVGSGTSVHLYFPLA